MTSPAKRFALGLYALWLLAVASAFFLVGVGELLRDGYRRVAD